MMNNLHGRGTDTLLSEHHGCKQIVANFFSILFSAGLLNLINRCVTGQWMFFNKTRSENKVSNVELALGVDLHEPIKFDRR